MPHAATGIVQHPQDGLIRPRSEIDDLALVARGLELERRAEDGEDIPTQRLSVDPRDIALDLPGLDLIRHRRCEECPRFAPVTGIEDASGREEVVQGLLDDAPGEVGVGAYERCPPFRGLNSARNAASWRDSQSADTVT
jgi:hypothetical protein